MIFIKKINFSFSTKSVAVLGGGISGLSSSYFLLKKFPNLNVTLYEKNPSVGGALKTINMSSNKFLEMGPSSIRKSAQINEMMKVIRDIGLKDQIVPSESFNKVFLYYDNKLRTFPRSFSPKVFSKFLIDNRNLIGKLFKIKQNKEFKYTINKKEDYSIEELFDHHVRFGRFEFPQFNEQLKQIAGALFNGIYAANISELSAKICWEKCHHNKYYKKYFNHHEYKKLESDIEKLVNDKIGKSGSFTFNQGLNAFPTQLLKFLKEKYPNNFKILENKEILSINIKEKGNIAVKTEEKEEFYDKIISALPLNNIKSMIDNQNIKSILESIQLNSLARVNLYYEKDLIPKKLNSFGFLILPNENKKILGMTFDSKSFPLNKADTRISIMIGNEILKSNVDSLEKIALENVNEFLRISDQPNEIRTEIWRNYMPVFGLGHFEKMNRLFSEVKNWNKNFHITGNFIFSAAVPELFILNKCLIDDLKFD